ncbi:MAG TPA: hypothetical protein VMW72_01380 [Sedimentisphaerales bacterium]|nr:hypothetical protein [Sedimentisphaerales bacterium]
MKKEISSDYVVGKIAALSMYIALLFLLLQVFVWIPCMVILVLVENGTISKSYEGLASLIIFVLSELIIIGLIIIHIKRKYLPFELSKYNNRGQVKPFIFKEKYLEINLNIIAGVGILWILLLGMPVNSIRYMLIVIHAFGIIFFTIFFIVRLLLTRQVAFRTLFSILLSTTSIWVTTM